MHTGSDKSMNPLTCSGSCCGTFLLILESYRGNDGVGSPKPCFNIIPHPLRLLAHFLRKHMWHKNWWKDTKWSREVDLAGSSVKNLCGGGDSGTWEPGLQHQWCCHVMDDVYVSVHLLDLCGWCGCLLPSHTKINVHTLMLKHVNIHTLEIQRCLFVSVHRLQWAIAYC